MSTTKNKDSKRRVVVTGLGVVSSIGIGVEEFWKNLIAGKSGITDIESFDTSQYPVHKGGEVKNFKPEHFIDKRKLKHMGRASQMAIAATKLALQEADLNEKKLGNVPVVFGTTMGETQILEKLNKSWVLEGQEKIESSLIPAYSSNNLSVNTGINFLIKGFNAVMPTACSSANYAIGYCFDLIASGKYDVAFCGGVDAFSRVAFIGFNRLFVMATENCQPFDKNRKGMLLGEGAAVLTLESWKHAERRGANIYAEILGYGLSCDAYHMTQPSDEGISRCIEKAITDSAIEKNDIGYISAHGTGTPQNDKTECSAIKRVFGEKSKMIPCSSIKSMLGHTMGAASAMESIACCMSLKNQIVPPTINFVTHDEECDIDCVPNKSRHLDFQFALNNSCAFGGNNAALIFKDN